MIILLNHCLAYGIGVVSPEEIDEINIYEASRKAMLIAISKVREQINLEHVLIDAMPINIDIPTTSIIKGDAKSISIAAASVVAKVTRDKMMYELDEKYRCMVLLPIKDILLKSILKQFINTD